MLPDKPEDWPACFTQHLNTGELDAVMDLYEPEARFVTRSGETLAGRDRIREPLAAMIRSKTKLHDPNARDCGKERHENARGAENKQ